MPPPTLQKKRWPKWARISAWILGILIALQVVAFVSVKSLAARFGGNEALHAQIQLRSFATTLAMRKALGEPYPSNVMGLDEVFRKEPKYMPLMNSTAVDDLLKDPWGHPFVYYCPGKHNRESYDLFSIGPDGVEGTGDDVTNW